MSTVSLHSTGRQCLIHQERTTGSTRTETGHFNMKEKIRLLVVDDHPVVRKGISMCLGHRPDMEVVGEAADAREAISKAHELQPDVVLMDIAMPDMSGLTATSRLRHELPETKVLILSIHDSPEYLCQAIQAGARGYVLKGVSAEELVHAAEAVCRGETYFSGNLMHVTLGQFLKRTRDACEPQLTGREREVLVQIAEGRSNKEAAAELGVSVRTVETHRENLMRKLDIHSAAGLTRFAVGKGFVPVCHDLRNAAAV